VNGYLRRSGSLAAESLELPIDESLELPIDESLELPVDESLELPVEATARGALTESVTMRS
jgi:hypothetical protein